MKNLKDTIIDKIRTNELEMKPKAYFTLRLVAVLMLSGLILAITVFLFNFIFFTLRVSGHYTLFSHGLAGVGVFLTLFPWWLFAADIILLVLLEKLLRQFRFAYRQPALYLFFILLALAVSVGIFVDRVSDVNERLLHQADEDRLPGAINDFYRTARRLPPQEYWESSSTHRY